MEHSKKPTYLFSIDAMRVVAIISVISIHLSIKILQHLDHNISETIIPFVMNQSTRFAVPLFFLISGFVLELNMNKATYVEFLKKRTSKVIIPFLFWSFVYIIYGSGLNFLSNFNLKLINNIIQGNASYHLYFIPTLIIFYLIFPILHTARNYLQKPIILLPLVFIEGYLLYTDYYIRGLQINPDQRIALLSFLIFLLGIVAGANKDKTLNLIKTNFPIILLSFIILAILMPLHVYNLTISHHTTRYIYSQYNILNYLYTLSLAAVLFFVLEKGHYAKRYIISLSKLSFFVFFIHVLIQNLVWEYLIQKIISNFGTEILKSFWLCPVLLFFLTSISFSIAYIAHRIKYIHKITG